jgi:hypothetical protein
MNVRVIRWVRVIGRKIRYISEKTYISDNTHISSVVYISIKCNIIIIHTCVVERLFLLRAKGSPYCCVSGRAILKVRKPEIVVKHL